MPLIRLFTLLMRLLMLQMMWMAFINLWFIARLDSRAMPHRNDPSWMGRIAHWFRADNGIKALSVIHILNMSKPLQIAHDSLMYGLWNIKTSLAGFLKGGNKLGVLFEILISHDGERRSTIKTHRDDKLWGWDHLHSFLIGGDFYFNGLYPFNGRNCASRLIHCSARRGESHF